MLIFNLLFLVTAVISGQADVVADREYQEYLRSPGGGGRGRGSLIRKPQYNAEGKLPGVDKAFNGLSEVAKFKKFKSHPKAGAGGDNKYNAGNTQKTHFSGETKKDKKGQEKRLEYSEGSQFDGENQADVAFSENGGAKFNKGSQFLPPQQKNPMPSTGTQHGRGPYSLPIPPSSPPYYKNVQNFNSNQINSIPQWQTAQYHNGRGTNITPFYTQSHNPHVKKNVFGQKRAFPGPYGLYPNHNSVNKVVPLDQMQGLGPQNMHNGMYSQTPWDLDDLGNRIIKLEDAIRLGVKFDPIQYRGVTYALLQPSKLSYIHNYLQKIEKLKDMIQTNTEKTHNADTLDEESPFDKLDQESIEIQAESEVEPQVQPDALEQQNVEDEIAASDTEDKTNNEYGGDYSSEAGIDNFDGAEVQTSGEDTDISSYEKQMQLKPGSHFINYPKQHGLSQYNKGLGAKGSSKGDRNLYEQPKAPYDAENDWDNEATKADAISASDETTESRFGQQHFSYPRGYPHPQRPQHTFRQPRNMRWHRG